MKGESFMLEVLEELRSRIGMDANYFYQACVSILISLISFAIPIFKNIKNSMENKIWDLQSVRKDEYFYGFVLIAELLLSTIELILIQFIGNLINIIFDLNTCMVAALEICLIIICSVISIKILLKSVLIRKRIIGSKKKKNLICISAIICYYYVFINLFEINIQLLNLIALIAYFILEIYGLIIFRGYIQYKYASVLFYLSNKTVIECVDISEITRKYNCLIIYDGKKQVRIKYDAILRVEYFGGVRVKLLGTERKKYKSAI